MTIKARAGRGGTCCSLRSSEMTGQSGERTVNSHLLCTFNWAFGAGIINMQLQSPWECVGEVWASVRLCFASVFVSTCGSLLICVPRVSNSHSVPLCAERERRRKAHLNMRSQIIHLTLCQEGSTACRRVKLKESEERKRGEESEMKGEEKQTLGRTVWTAERAGGDWMEGKTDEEVLERASGKRWSKKENEVETRHECYCAFLSEWFYSTRPYNVQRRV